VRAFAPRPERRQPRALPLLQARAGGAGAGVACAAAAVAEAEEGKPPSSGAGAAGAGGRVVAAVAFALLLANMCRVCMAVAIVPIAGEFGWSAATCGLVQSAFLWGYTATQLLGGWLADKHGGKVVLAWGMVVFGVCTVLTPAALGPAALGAGVGLPALLLARAAVGLGEGVAMPSMNNLIATHVPKERRAQAVGTAFMGFHSGTIIGLLVSPPIIMKFGWQGLFLTYGLLAIPTLVLWRTLVPTPKPAPDAAAEVAKGSAESSEDAGMGRLLREPAIWAIIIANTCNHWNYFIYLNWLPTYFYQALGVNLKASTLYSVGPWVAMAVFSYVAGFAADRLVNSGVSVTLVRKLMQTISFLGPAACLWPIAAGSLPPAGVLACFTSALALASFGQAGFIPNMQDVAPRHAGRLFGLCNTAGSLAGILGTAATGVIVQQTGSWQPVFYIMVALYVVGTVVWNILCTGERVV